MTSKPLVMISTRLAPGACGIGTYSLLLRKHWPAAASEQFEFVVNEGGQQADGLPAGDRVSEFSNNAARLTRELERVGVADVLLQYAGRAYHRFGAPLWLPGVLRRWKQKHPGARLMIFFHELPGKLPMMSRHYWLGELNAWVVRQLSAAADVLATNTEHHAATLRKLSARADVHVVPIGSNIEPITDQPDTARLATEFLLFGLSFGRLQTLQSFASDVPRWHSAGKLATLHVVGPQDDSFSTEADALMNSWPASIEIIRHGMLPSPDVSQILQRASFALTNVSEETWSKSGAFMACATHGCAVIISGTRPPSPPLSYAIAASEVDDISADEVAARTAALSSWAAQNASWPVIASRVASLLRNGAASHVG